MCVMSDRTGNTEMERRWWGWGSGHGSGTPLVLAWTPQSILSSPSSHQYCTCCPTPPALVPQANTGGGMRSTHVKAIPLISTNGPQERALSPTSKAGTGTAASLEQVCGTPESLPPAPPPPHGLAHSHREMHTYIPHHRVRGKGQGRSGGSQLIRLGWGRGVPRHLSEAKPLQGLFSTMSMAENGE